MKNKCVSLALATLSLIAVQVGLSQQVQAKTTKFACVVSKGIPTTFAQTSRGNIPIIRWVSEEFSASGWTPMARCQDVSPRFQKLHENGRLKFLTTGTMKDVRGEDQQVVCGANEEKGACRYHLFNIKKTSTPSETLTKLMLVRSKASGATYESSSKRLYIDMVEYLDQAETESIVQPLTAPKAEPKDLIW